MKQAETAGVPFGNELNARTWRRIIHIAVGCAVATLAVELIGPGRMLTWAAALLTAGWAWYAAIRLLLLKTRLRIFWIVWLGLALFWLVIFGDFEARFVVALLMSIAFLTFRLYRPYRYLTSQRRIMLGLGSLAFMIILPGALGAPEEAGRLARFAYAGGLWALWSFKVFCAFTAVHLFFSMRLHFMRLKPKLAVTAFFLAVVPIVLILLFSILSLNAILVRDRSLLAVRILQAEAIALLTHQLPARSDHFALTTGRDGPRLTGTASPPWLTSLTAAVSPQPTEADSSSGGGDPAGPLVFYQRPDQTGFTITIGGESDTLSGIAWTPADSTFLFQVGEELWVLFLEGVYEPDLQVRGVRLDEAFMDRIAQRLDSDLSLRGGHASPPDSLAAVARAGGWPGPLSLRGFTVPAERDPEFGTDGLTWNPGMTFVPCLVLDEGVLETDALMLLLTTSPWRFLATAVSGPELVDQALLVVLIVFAVILLIIELGALFLGIRITRGVTSAVSVLHAGTLRLAAGDLETQIEIPNQDEFGDLAASFNEMTVAVQNGREEALARERLEKELETARSIQEKLLPHDMPAVPGFEFAATSIPSRQVGGDYFDFIETGESRLGVAIADVSGKGIPAALLMANLQAALQGQVIHPGNVAAVVGRVNELLVRSSEVHMYATFFYGVLDRTTARFTYCNAGHNPPIVQRANGRREFLEEGGIVVGMMGGIAYEEATVELDPGDVIVMYTDGVSEAVGPQAEAAAEDALAPTAETPGVGGESGVGEEMVVPVKKTTVEHDTDADDDDEDGWGEEENMFGEERLYDLVEAAAGESAAALRDAIMEAVAEFSAGIMQSDDITVVVLCRLPE